MASTRHAPWVSRSRSFAGSPVRFQKAIEWTRRREEFVRRAGFVLMAALAVHDRQTPDEPFERFLRIIARGSADERNAVEGCPLDCRGCSARIAR